MSDKLLITHCAPTLAGLKSGSLFSCICKSAKQARRVVAHWNSILNRKGVNAVIMKISGDRVLIYVYRPEKLAAELARTDVQEFLLSCGYGYGKGDLFSLLAVLTCKLNSSNEFPHEIGLFLGYPLADVQGFINNKGQNSHMTGYWKVYSNTEYAVKKFKSYTKCTDVYARKMRDGSTLDRLTVSGRYI